MGYKNGTPAERLQGKYAVAETGCWEWTAALDERGYGQMHMPAPNRMVRAHRIAWLVHRGEIPAGLHVLHRCDNRRCINPEHLYLGTHQQNMRDRQERGRTDRHIGSANGRARLTEEQVARIKRDDRWPRFIAKDYGVTVHSIKNIKYGVTWRHVK